MRKKLILAAIIFFLPYYFGLVNAGFYTPSWTKPGVYFTYAALTNSTENGIPTSIGGGTLFLLYNDSGTLVSVHYYGNCTVTFRFLDIKDNMIPVIIDIYGQNVLVVYSGHITYFWNNSDVVNTSVHGSEKEVELRKLELRGFYFINLTNGNVYDSAGRLYGKTMLWYEPRIKEGDLLFRNIGGQKVNVFKIETLNTTIATFYRSFKPPVVNIITSPFSVALSSNLHASGKSVVYYDPSTRFLLAYLGFSWSDFQAAGFPMLGGFSTYTPKHSKGFFPSGLVLLNTNAGLSTKKIQYSQHLSPLLYMYIGVSVGGIILFILRGWKK
ncbi:hypothetical protein [Thermococcus sp.]